MDLGWDPPQGSLLLPVGGPFTAALVSSTPWPAGMVIDLLIEGEGSPITWTADIDGDTALFEENIASVAAVLSSARRTATLRGTPDGGEPAVWYRLTVRAV